MRSGIGGENRCKVNAVRDPGRREAERREPGGDPRCLRRPGDARVLVLWTPSAPRRNQRPSRPLILSWKDHLAMKLETLCLHGGTQPDPTTLSRGVPVYRTSSYVFKSAEHAANLFAPEGAREHLHAADEPDDRRAREARRAAGRCARAGRAGRRLGHQRGFFTRSSTWPRTATTSSRPATFTAAPTPSSTTSCRRWASRSKFVDSNDPQNFARAIDDKTRALFCETRVEPGPGSHRPGGRRQGRPRPRPAPDRGQHVLDART